MARGDANKSSPLFEIARVLVRFNDGSDGIVNANHRTVSFITGRIPHAGSREDSFSGF